MSSSNPKPAYEGVFAIHKPLGITSAQVIRDAQEYFNPSNLFQPWFERENQRRQNENHNQRQKRRSWKQRQSLQLKMGHGGTLDPMATGVLILGVGSGTKSLSKFLDCTKSYEAVVLFGAATDTYDSMGKVVAKKPHEHLSKALVEEALSKFRGKIMQRPPIFSALKVQGKPLYQYAREGKEVPIEIEERPVEVESLEMVEWMEGGTHNFNFPEEEAPEEEKAVVEKVLHLDGDSGNKRKRSEEKERDGTGLEQQDSPKRLKSSPAPENDPPLKAEEPELAYERSRPRDRCPAPACRLRMTVTSGFYVRSLAHDLGAAVNSLALMSGLVRTRQGDFELGKNVLEYDDLAKGEEDWGPKVEGMLADWQDREGGESGRDKTRRNFEESREPRSKSRSRDGRDERHRKRDEQNEEQDI